MTAEAARLAHQKPSKKHKHKKKKPTKQSLSPTSLNSIEALNSLQWNPSLPIDTEDPFGNDTEGGFLSLEEIDASEYDLAFPQSKKRSRSVIDADTDGCDGGGSEAVGEEKVKKKKKKRSKKKKKSDETISDTDEQEINNVDQVIEDELIEDEEYKAQFYAWNELRLHPLIMKAIYALGFKEPTPVQKACIPAAAHRGKDVIGASETGSGKTLAFGIPILQRLLEEQEKAKNSLSAEEEGSKVEEGAQGSPLRALIVAPTRELALQVSDHLKKVARFTSIMVVSIVGKMYKEKQERLLKYMPEIIVGTPGRLWDLMSGGDHHLSELHSLSFFVLDEADRMVESGHFHELQSIIDMLPTSDGSVENHRQDCVTVSNIQKKKRQTLMFSATIALSTDFRKKLKHGSHEMRKPMDDGRTNSLETLSQRAGMRADAAIVDLTNTSIMANKLEESFVECREEDKDAYLYYLLSVHGQRRTIVFCTSIAALRHISSLLRILAINVWTLHSQMQQRARLKSIDHFRGNEHAVLVATDVAARGLDIPGVRTVIHYQLPHSADVYVHRSGRTARASAEGCCIALISPNDGSKFASLCKSFSKESYQRFPLDNSYMPEVIKRVSLARQIDKILRKESQEKATKTWFKRNAEPVEMIMEDNDSEEDIVNRHKQKKRSSFHLKHLQQELNLLLSRPLEPQAFSHRFLAGSGVSPLVQGQFEEIAKQKAGKNSLKENNKRKFVVIGQDCIDPLEALQNAQNEGHVDVKEKADKQRNVENLRRKRKQEKKGLRENRKKQRKQRNRLEKSGE